MTIPTIELVPLYPLPHARLVGVLVSCSICLALAWFIALLRFWTRLRLIRSAGWDDFFMALALVCYTVFNAAVITNFVDIYGRRFLSAHLMTRSVNFLLVAESLYSIGMIFIKVSLGLFFVRIAVEPYQKRIAQVVMVVYSLVGLSYFFFTIFQCGAPIRGPSFWMKTVTHHCQHKATALGMAYMHGIATALTDLVFATLPIPLLRNSMMPRKEKVMVGGILFVATLGSTASLARLAFIRKLTEAGFDYWNNMSLLAIISTIETGLAISAASLATLRPLVRAISSRFRSYRQSYRSGRSGSDKLGNVVEKDGSPIDTLPPHVTLAPRDGGRRIDGNPKLFSVVDEETGFPEEMYKPRKSSEVTV